MLKAVRLLVRQNERLRNVMKDLQGVDISCLYLVAQQHLVEQGRVIRLYPEDYVGLKLPLVLFLHNAEKSKIFDVLLVHRVGDKAGLLSVQHGEIEWLWSASCRVDFRLALLEHDTEADLATTTARDVFEGWIEDYLVLLADGALAIQLMRQHPWEALPRLRQLFTLSGRWIENTVLTEKRARRASFAHLVTQAISRLPTALQLEWLDIERLLVALVPSIPPEQPTKISIDEWLRASSQNLAGSLLHRRPTAIPLPMGAPHACTVSAGFVRDSLRPHQHFEHCKTLLLQASALEPCEDLGLITRIRSILLSKNQLATAQSAYFHPTSLREEFAALVKQLFPPNKPTTTTVSSTITPKLVCAQVESDIEELAQHLPPCMAHVRDHGRRMGHLKNDDRFRMANWYAALGFGLQHIADLRKFTLARPNDTEFEEALKWAFTHPPRGTFGCRSVRESRQKLAAGNVVSCPYATNQECMRGTTFSTPADFVALHLATKK